LYNDFIKHKKPVTKLEINQDQKAFSMPVSHLFEVIQNIVAHPHKVLTTHDKQRAAKIFLALQDYVGNHTQCYEDSGCFVDRDPALDFDTYVESIFDEDELDEIRRMG
jgi:hypothetical protein